jgi:hypothetical protein
LIKYETRGLSKLKYCRRLLWNVCLIGIYAATNQRRVKNVTSAEGEQFARETYIYVEGLRALGVEAVSIYIPISPHTLTGAKTCLSTIRARWAVFVVEATSKT